MKSLAKLNITALNLTKAYRQAIKDLGGDAKLVRIKPKMDLRYHMNHGVAGVRIPNEMGEVYLDYLEKGVEWLAIQHENALYYYDTDEDWWSTVVEHNAKDIFKKSVITDSVKSGSKNVNEGSYFTLKPTLELGWVVTNFARDLQDDDVLEFAGEITFKKKMSKKGKAYNSTFDDGVPVLKKGFNYSVKLDSTMKILVSGRGVVYLYKNVSWYSVPSMYQDIKDVIGSSFNLTVK